MEKKPNSNRLNLLGERLGKIRIIDHLGKGGMGEVYVGFDEKLKRKVAVKAIRGEKRFDERAKSRFIREAELLSQLEHPHICRIYDYLEHEDADVLILELINGVDLKKALEAGLSREEKLKVAIQIAEVLSDAHANRVVHRDLKPENVMIDDRGEVKVLDFGLAYSIVGPDIAAMTVTDVPVSQTDETIAVTYFDGGYRTEHGIVLGTPMYMSPEQARGEPATAASDMFSFGLLLQWLFTGKYPYPMDMAPEKVMLMAMKGETLPADGVEPELRKRIDRLKAFEPSVRPNALDTVERLAWIQDAPKRRKKRRMKTAVATLIGLLLVLGTTFSTWGFIKARRAEAKTREEAKTAQETVALLQQFLSSVDPAEKGKDLKVIELLEAFQPRLDEVEKVDIRVSLFDTYALTYNGLGDYDKAYEFADKALVLSKEKLGEDHPDTLAVMDGLALTQWRLGRYEEAETTLREVVEKSRRVFGEEHGRTLNSMNLLAVTLWRLGRIDEAEKLQRDVMEKSKRVLGENHRKTLDAVNNLTAILSNLGRLEEVEALQREGLEKSRRILGQEHPDTLVSLGNLGTTLARLGRYAEAEPIQRDAFEKCKRILGEDHPTTLFSMNTVAGTLADLGRYEEAEKMMALALEKRSRVLGEDHPDTLNSMSHLAYILARDGRYSEAEKLDRKVLEKNKEILGENHPETLTSMVNLGSTLWYLGRYEEAEALQRQGMEKNKRVLGDDHPNTLNSMDFLIATLLKLGRLEEAEGLARDLVEKSQRVLGEDHPSTLKSMKRLIDILRENNRIDEAKDLEAELRAIQDEVP